MNANRTLPLKPLSRVLADITQHKVNCDQNTTEPHCNFFVSGSTNDAAKAAAMFIRCIIVGAHLDWRDEYFFHVRHRFYIHINILR